MAGSPGTYVSEFSGLSSGNGLANVILNLLRLSLSLTTQGEGGRSSLNAGIAYFPPLRKSNKINLLLSGSTSVCEIRFALFLWDNFQRPVEGSPASWKAFTFPFAG